MDPGTALAVVSLSFQVFGGIIKGFTLLAKAHNLGRDATLLRTMLCVEESRFLQWGRAVQLLKDSDLQSGGSDGNNLEQDTVTSENDPGAIDEGSVQVQVDPRLNYALASQLMAQLQIILTTDGLRQRYKLDLVEKPDPKPSLAGANSTSLAEESEAGTTVLEKLVPDTLRQRILFRARCVQKNNHLPKRLWWAAVDKQKFENMVCDVRDIVNGLWNLLNPVQQEDSSAMLRQILAGVIQISHSVSELCALRQPRITNRDDTPTYTDDVVSLAADLKLTRIEFNDIELVGMTEAPTAFATISAMNRSMLTNVTQSSINNDVARGFYDGQPVWIEYKDVPKRLKGKLITRVKNLALLLALTKNPSFHTLRCHGYLEEEARFVFIYHWPDSSISQISRETRFAMSLTELIRDVKTFASVSITDRLQVARELCKTLLAFHTAGWLHKDIRSDNVMFFQENGWSMPYITGFSFARQDSPSEISEQPSQEPSADIYRHPHALGEPSTSFQKHMDMYSLGLVLLELAEWKALKHIVAKCVEIRKVDSNVGVRLDSIADIPKWLDKHVIATGQIKFRMGDIYADIAHTCLQYGLTSAEECPDTLPDLLRFVRNLERICVVRNIEPDHLGVQLCPAHSQVDLIPRDLPSRTRLDQQQKTSSENTNLKPIFIPNVFDLVWMGRRAELSVVRPDMQLYLGAQAVDQSSFLGQGASFEVSSKKMPRSEGFVFETHTSGLILAIRQGQHDERTLVYKTARIAFSNMGEPLAKDHRAMNSVMMEIYALMHPPLYEHANIVTLLALGWGTNPFESSYRLPVIVTEYADQGNLADLQDREVLTSELKRTISLDIAHGLQILHRCGIIHGDLKSENVLIFSHPQKTYVAKLGDFGFSILGEASAPRVNIGRTMPWRAPESSEPIAREHLAKTDVYSYGLTVWRIAMDGGNPFSVLHGFGNTASGRTLTTFTSQLRDNDLVKDQAQLNHWYRLFILYAHKKRHGETLHPEDQIVQLSQRRQAALQTGNTNTSQELESLKYMFWLVYQLGTPSEPLFGSIGEQLVATALSDGFYGKLDTVLAGCLSKVPESRDLSVAISTLSSSNEGQQNTVELSEDVVLRQSFDHHNMSWQAVRDLQPSVQTFLFERFRARADEYASRNQVNTSECFVLASFYMNAYGTQSNLQEARRLILHAAANGHQVAQANVWRIAKVTGTELVTSASLQQILERQAFNGSRGALQDLAIIAPERAVEVRRVIKAGLAGVGASFWDDDLLHGNTHGAWVNTFRDTTVMVENMRNLREIADYKVNRRGDRILHMASSCGQLQAVEALLDNFPSLNVDQLNDVGETPLLCACRSGHREVVESLLNRGANPAMATSSKETPLHWLISFDEDEAHAVGQALISAGADIRALTTKQINYSEFPSGIDIDNLPPGTPLTWAVFHDRPDIIKFLLSQPESIHLCLIKAATSITPLEWAAQFHHRHCLEAMIVAMKGEKVRFTYQEFLKAAVHGADMFSMVFRNGTQYLEKMKDTLDYLLEETHGASFATGLGGFGYTLLYYAISEGHDLVAKYLLASETEALLRAGRERLEAVVNGEGDMPVRRYGVFSEEHINTPCGTEQRTPLLECIRWNHHELFESLISRGADIHAKSRNPFDGSRTDWSALHTFAYAAHDLELTLVRKIIDAGIEVDAQSSGSADLETPLLVALKNNAFSLAQELLRRGGNINAACISSGLITLEHSTTVLGHLVAPAARGSIARMQALLNQPQAAEDHTTMFVVEPQRHVTALHLASRAHKGVFDRIPDGKSSPVAYQRAQYDFAQNRDILNELLQHFGSSNEVVNARTGEALFCRTALHLAVNAVNLNAVELLLDRNSINISLQDSNGQTALDLAYLAALHQNIQCDGPCQRSPLPGRRWHCKTCPDHDLCETCYRGLEDGQSAGDAHTFEEVTLKQTNDAAAKKDWRIHISAEQSELAQIIEMLQSRSVRDEEVLHAANTL